jgi:AraC-like DNA-binding protein
MSPRRLTGSEEAELVRAMHKVARAHERLGAAQLERDQLALSIRDRGARVIDIARVLGVSRNTLLTMFDRARERR